MLSDEIIPDAVTVEGAVMTLPLHPNTLPLWVGASDMLTERAHALVHSDQKLRADLAALRKAVGAVYNAGYWTLDREGVDEVGLWTELRDAAGIKPGTNGRRMLAEGKTPPVMPPNEAPQDD